MWIAACALATVYAGSMLPTPLYLDYRRAFGFSEIVLTLIYASYVIGNLTALFVFGRLSDQLGRRAVTLSALGLAAVSTLLFGFASSTAWLFGARILSGLAIGIAAGTLTAWIAELHPAGKGRAAIVTAAFNLAGLGAGAIVSGLLSRYGPWPLHLVYFMYLGTLGLNALLVARSHETVKAPVEARDVALRPRIGVPKEMRLAFVSPAATAFATFALLGFYAALAPSLLATALHQTSSAVAGAVVGELFVAATATVLVTGTLRGHSAAFVGLLFFFPSVALLVLAQIYGSMPLIVIGTACSGVATALGYRGSLAVINDIAPNERRAEVVSCYLIAAYVGNSLPVTGIGVLSRLTTPQSANTAFSGMICMLAIVGLVMGARFSGTSNP